jgi:hypothetical protein
MKNRLEFLKTLFFGALALVVATGVGSGDVPSAEAGRPPDEPILRIEADMHTAQIIRIAVDGAGRYLITASKDKTGRVWDLGTGELLRVLRVPIGSGNEGKLYAVAISPDGKTVAAGGWTKGRKDFHNIYLFDRASGRMKKRIPGLPNVIFHLAYSPDGRFLVATLGGKNGIRVYRTRDYGEAYRDTEYNGDSYWAAFDRQGRLVTTCEDGYLRLYDPSFRFAAKKKAPGGRRPFGVSFSPDGTRVAVGFLDSTSVNVLSGRDLSFLYGPDTRRVGNGNLATVAWSRDGRVLYAGGGYDDETGTTPILRWTEAGRGPYTALSASTDTILDILPLADGRVVFGASDPTIGVFDASGHRVWTRQRPILDLRMTRANLLISPDGSVVQFGYRVQRPGETWTRRHARFDLNQGRLSLNPTDESPVKRVQKRLSALGYAPGPADGILGPATRFAIRAFERAEGLPVRGELSPALLRALGVDELSPPRMEAPGIEITGWKNTYEPRLNGKALTLDQYERSRSLAIAPDGRRFLLGAEWSLRFFDREGKQLWEVPVPASAWAVNIASNGRVGVAAFGDGTIRWYLLSDGQEILALFPAPDGKRWVLWVPEGFFNAASGGEALIGYHLNRGPDEAGEFVGVDQLYDLFYRPDLVAKRLQGRYEKEILAELRRIGDIRQVLASGLPPGVELLSPQEVRLDRRDFTLKLRLKDQGGGIGRVVYRVNGVTVETAADARPVPISVAGRRSGAIRRPFTLQHGENTITVTAYDRHNKIESRSVKLRVYVDDPLYRRPSLYVLAVGITSYRDHALKLRYAAGDARAMAEELGRRGQGLFQAIEVKRLLDREATTRGIESAFEELASRVKPSDVFVLYLAGHGTVLDDGRYYFIPWELRYENQEALRDGSIDQSRLRTLLGGIPALKSLVMLDTCNSGGFAARGLSEKAAIDRLMRATGRNVLAASSDSQLALEGYRGHGVFTYALLQGLRGQADRRGDRDGTVDIDELAEFVSERVPQITMEHWHYEQIPMRKLEGDPFPIGRSK